ncbi:MAG: HPr(Ser) kinase/phosphatase [Opitutae bacterium]|nr:HPr(Ser) kinase/phosphatase [Opitutae bacterium]|tara:strand:- start:1916 stop:2881 length:966 start_codon:yes stop_codon:yes gene_type:complete
MPSRQSMKIIESIAVRDFYESFKGPLKLRLVSKPETLARSKVREKSINRPALTLTGHFKYFANKRIQLFGAGEMSFLRELSDHRQKTTLTSMLERKIPCIVISRNFAPTKVMLQVMEKFGVPLFRTPLTSKEFSTAATVLLEERFAPRTSLHGTLMDVRGIGVLIRGESGSGKSETAIALLHRGHSLVADDVVRVKLLSDHTTPVGTSPDLNRGYMECRGIGIVNVVELFGVQAVRIEKRIEVVVTFIEWEPGMEVERTGLDEKHFEILGAGVPHMEIPIRPGRDMARLVEVAVMVQALKLIGHDPAKEFSDKLLAEMNKE